MSAPNALFDLAERGLKESIAIVGETFQWKGTEYGGVIDHKAHTIVTLASNFIANGKTTYPKCGDAIIVAGKRFQITKKGNAELKAVAGGFIEDPPFVDDQADPGLEIGYDHFIKK